MTRDAKHVLSPRTSYNVELNSKPDRTGRSSVMIRLHQRGERPGRVLTSVKIENCDRHWNSKKTWGRWVVKHPDAAALNSKIISEYNRIRDQSEGWISELLTGQQLTPAQIAERFRGEVSDRYFILVDKVLDESKDQAYATYLAKRSAVNLFREWAGEDIPLRSVTADLVRRYLEYLRWRTNNQSGLPLNPSTINKYVDRLDHIHQQVLIKTGVYARQAPILSPWGEVESLKTIKPRKEKLHEHTINRIATLNVKTNRRRLTPEMAFQIWMLSHSLAGMRFSDLIQLRYLNFTIDEQGYPTHLDYEMSKTGHHISFTIPPQARSLLSHWWKRSSKPTNYILPLLDSASPTARIVTHEQYKASSFEIKKRLYNSLAHWNRQLNTCLKQIEQIAGLPGKLRMHNARHSFADMARRIMQESKAITPYDIQMMLGHSSLKQIESYIAELSGQDVSQPMNIVFGGKSA